MKFELQAHKPLVKQAPDAIFGRPWEVGNNDLPPSGYYMHRLLVSLNITNV